MLACNIFWLSTHIFYSFQSNLVPKNCCYSNRSALNGWSWENKENPNNIILFQYLSSPLVTSQLIILWLLYCYLVILVATVFWLQYWQCRNFYKLVCLKEYLRTDIALVRSVSYKWRSGKKMKNCWLKDQKLQQVMIVNIAGS